MKNYFKKISAIGASVLLTGMTMGVAAAANYPAPFVAGDSANVAIVYGAGASADIAPSYDIYNDLQASYTGTGGSSDSVEGEAFDLWTGNSNIYMNESVSSVRGTLTDTELPTVLKDGDFEGDVSADFTQTIIMGTYPTVVYGKHPTSDDEPVVAIVFGETATTQYLYNATVTFNKAVNLTASDSIGEELELFGSKFTVGAGSTLTDLYLYESSETIALSKGSTAPASAVATVNGEEYTFELDYSTDTSARIVVTDSSGNSDGKIITVDNSKKINGVDVAVNAANEDASGVQTVEITVGADKMKLTSDTTVKMGSDETTVRGTNVVRTGASWGAVTAFTIQVAAEDGDADAIVEGESFTDPVFGSFKVSFNGISIPADSSSRETISINTATDKATIEFTNHEGYSSSFNWYYNDSATARLADSGGDLINTLEMEEVNYSEYLVLGLDDEGYLLEFVELTNDTAGTGDTIKFRNVFPNAAGVREEYTVTGITTEGTGSLVVGGKTHTVTYKEQSTSANDYVKVAYADSTTANHAIIYPTIETNKGAKIAFYEPKTITLTSWDGTSTLSTLKFPSGYKDAYVDVAFTYVGNFTGAGGTTDEWNVTVGGASLTTVNLNGTAAAEVKAITVGELTYQLISTTTANQTTVKLDDVGGTVIDFPAVIMFEERDDEQDDEALIVKMEGAGTDANEVGVSDIEFTWNDDANMAFGWNNEIQMESNSKHYVGMDMFGTMVLTDQSTDSSYDAEIYYPDEQVYAKVRVGELDFTSTAGSSGTAGGTLGDIVIMDSELTSGEARNLILVGGSCVNSAAASVLGLSAGSCGSAWTDATNVGSGQFLIQSFGDSSLTSGIALLVAGYEAADTVNAATYLQNKPVDTSAGKKYVGTNSQTAELVVAE